MIERFEVIDQQMQESYPACRLTSSGIDWLLSNQSRFRLRKNKELEEEAEESAATPIADEDIPF